MGDTRNEHKQRLNIRPRHGLEDNTKMDPKEIGCGLDSPDSI